VGPFEFADCGFGAQVADNPDWMLDRQTAEEIENLKHAAARFEQLFQGLPLSCIGMDLGGTIFEWNRAGENMLGLDPAVLFMSSAFDVLCHDDNHRDRLDSMLSGVAQGQSYESFEWELCTNGNAPRFLLCSMLPKPGPTGDILGAILAGIDMTAQKTYERQIEAQLRQIHDYSVEIELSKSELEVANRRLESLASTDGLTGLVNHRAFFEALNQELSDPQKALSIISLDVDNFKMYNDTYGHPEGDTVLRMVAEAIKAVSRNNDIVARYGGEEFVVLLPGADSASAAIVAERMRRAIESQPWPRRKVTASFGVATRSAHSASELLVSEADAALYASKREGKNRVTVARVPYEEAAA